MSACYEDDAFDEIKQVLEKGRFAFLYDVLFSLCFWDSDAVDEHYKKAVKRFENFYPDYGEKGEHVK